MSKQCALLCLLSTMGKACTQGRDIWNHHNNLRHDIIILTTYILKMKQTS